MQRQDNIEIFVACKVERVLGWLSPVQVPVVLAEAMGSMLVYESRLGSVFLTPGIGGGTFMSVYMASAGTPWSTDVEFARQAAFELGCVVRCDPGQYYSGVHPASDIFLEIHRETEVLVHWRDDVG